jgi:hypothetical protein
MRVVALPLVIVLAVCGWSRVSDAAVDDEKPPRLRPQVGEEKPPRVFPQVDLMVRNADLLSLSGGIAVRLLGRAETPNLAAVLRLRAGVGGGTASVGLLGYVICPHADVPCLAVAVQAIVLRTWLATNWAEDTYVGGELRAQAAFFCGTVGMVESTSRDGDKRFQAGLGVGF